MIDIFQNMAGHWDDPSMRHAILVHSPIVLSMVAVPLVIASVILPQRATLRWIAGIALIALTGTAFMARTSGLEAEGRTGIVTPEASDLIAQHANLGNLAFFFAAALTIVFLLTAVPKKPLRVSASVVATVGCIMLAGWIAAAASVGGELVYQHGVGVERPVVIGADDHDEDSAVPSTDPRVAFFREQVWPVLEDRCLGCHRPGKTEGELDLTSMAAMLEGGEHEGPTVVPGQPNASAIVLVIGYDYITQMPPSDEGGKLPDEQIAAITQWIADGAVWEDPPALRDSEENGQNDGDDPSEE